MGKSHYKKSNGKKRVYRLQAPCKIMGEQQAHEVEKNTTTIQIRIAE